MSRCIFGLLLATLAVTAAADQPLEEFLSASLLELKKEMPAGIPALDIPPMDPYPMPNLYANWTNSLANVSIDLTEGWANGLSTFDPREVSAVDEKLEILLAFPAIRLNGTYTLNGTMLGLPLRGHGDADLALMDLTAICSAELRKDSGIQSVANLKVNLQRGAALLMLQRMIPVDDIVRALLQRFAEGVFDKSRPTLEAVLGDALTKALNAALALRSSGAATALSMPPLRVYEAGNANEFLDHMIAQARPALAEKDPLTLPDATKGFEKTILGVRIHGEAKIFDGFLNGIQTIHRTGDAEMTQSTDMTKLKITAKLGMSNLHGHYRMHAKFMNIGPSAEVSVKVSLVSVEIHVSVDMSAGKPKTSLEYFDINYIGNIDLHFDGLGPLDWLINPLGGWIINLVKNKIADAVEGPLRKIIADKIQGVEFPVGF